MKPEILDYYSVYFTFFLVLEGYLLYKALVVVFDTGENKKMPLYLFGYGVPLAIVMITLITAIVVERHSIYILGQ